MLLKKILSVLLIVLGILLILSELLTQITSNRPSSKDAAFLFGYYLASFLFAAIGALLIFWGIRIRKNLKKNKIKKQLIDSLPD